MTEDPPEPDAGKPRNALRVGARFGVIGCGGCAVFIALALAVAIGGSILLYKTQIEDPSTPSTISPAPQPVATVPVAPPVPGGIAEPDEVVTAPDPTGGRYFTCGVFGAGGGVHVVAFGPYALDTCNLITGAPPPLGGPWTLAYSEEWPHPGVSSPEPDPGFGEVCSLTAVDAAGVLVEAKSSTSTAVAKATCSYLVDQGLDDFGP